MGATFSTDGEASLTLSNKSECKGDIAKYIEDHGKKIGGADTDGFNDSEITKLVEYDDAAAVKNNNRLMNDTFEVITSALKLKPPAGINTPDQKTSWLLSVLPRPEKGKSITANKEKQRGLVVAIARGLNKVVGKQLIDPNGSSENICSEIMEFVNTIGIGSHKYFVNAAAGVQTGLNNITQLRALLDSSYNRLSNEAGQSEDSALVAKVAGMDSLHTALLNELDRQIQMLASITTSVLKPVDKDLINVLLENKDFKGLIAGLNASIGTKDGGIKLSQFLLGVNNISHLAAQVNKALKKIGMSLSEYRNIEKLNELKIKADELMRSKPDIDRKYITEFHAAVDMLSRNYGFHTEIADYLSKHKSGAFEGGRVTLDKRIKQQTNTKTAVIKAFKSKSHIYFSRILEAVVSMSKQIGSAAVPITYHLDRFIKTFCELEAVTDTDGLELALTGFQKHATAIAARTKFIGLLKSVIDATEPFMAGKGKSAFVEIKTNLESMLKLIDFYSTQMNVFDEHKVMGFTGKGEEVYGGAGDFSARTTLKNTVSTLKHFYNVAKMKSNLAVVTEETAIYNKNYQALLGETISNQIESVETEYRAFNKIVEGTGPNTTNDDDYKLVKSIDDKTFPGIAMVDGYGKSDITQFKNNVAAGKRELYRALQAIDMYLMDFSDNVAADPDNIKEITKILEHVEAIAEWFNDTSGDYVASFYESMPWFLGDNGKVEYNKLAVDVDTLAKNINNKTHYYKSVGDVLFKDNNTPIGVTAADAQFVGQPGLAMDPKKANKLHKFVRKMYEKVYALKNLVSLFAYLGDKFGSDATSSKVFLSPNEIYESLLTYLCASSMSMGWKESADAAGAIATAYSEFSTDPIVSRPPNGSLQAAAIRAGPVSDGNASRAGATDNEKIGYIRAKFGVVPTPSAAEPTNTKVWKDEFEVEDDLFKYAIKAMAAKVFTVAGLYNIMNYKTAPVPVLSTHRIILGGNDMTNTPQIHDDAVDLYIRLPMLAEFYKDIFGFKTSGAVATADRKAWRVSMVPEVDSIWSGFVRCVFDHPGRDAATYTDNQSIAVINEINGIYQRYKTKYSPADLTLRVINDFIAEINRRYGIISQGEMEDYITNDTIKRRALYAEPELTDYDILDSDKVGTGVAPSDMYGKVNAKGVDSEKFDKEHYKTVCEFRNRIDDRIRSAVNSYTKANKSSPLPQFTDQIMYTRESLNAAKTNDEKFKIIVRTIQGVDYMSKKGEESLMLFNELVVAPLALLTRIQSMLSKFTTEVMCMDLDLIMKTLQNGILAGNLHNHIITPPVAPHDNVANAHAGAGAGNAVVDGIKDPIATITADFPQYLRGQIAKVKLNMAHPTDGFLSGLAPEDTSYPVGYQGVEHELSPWSALRFVDLTGSDEQKRINAETAARMCIAWDRAFKNMTNLLYGISVDFDELVNVKAHGPNMIFDASKLQQYCEDMVASIRANIDKLRGSVPNDVIQKYEKHDTVGTVNWLQENLMDNVFGVRNEINITACTKVISNNYQLFRKDWAYHIRDKDLNGATPARWDATSGVNKWSFDAPMSELTHYNTITMCLESDSTALNNTQSVFSRFNLDGAAHSDRQRAQFMAPPQTKGVSINDDRLFELYKDASKTTNGDRESTLSVDHRIEIYFDGNNNSDKLRGDYHFQTRETNNATDTAATNTDAGMGVMMKFNEILNKYISQFIDVGNNKMYVNVLDGFVSGSHHNDIMSGHCWPDLYDDIGHRLIKAADTWWNTDPYQGDSDEKNGYDKIKADDILPPHKQDEYLKLLNKIGFTTNGILGGPAGNAVIARIALYGMGAGGGGPYNDAADSRDTGGAATANLVKIFPLIQIGIYLMDPAEHANGGLGREGIFLDVVDAKSCPSRRMGDPEGIVFASIGKKLRTLFSETASNTNTKRWIVDNIADVTTSMKENYKANMPLFNKWFKAISKKTNMIKQTLNTDISCERFDISIVKQSMWEDVATGAHRVGLAEFLIKRPTYGLNNDVFHMDHDFAADAAAVAVANRPMRLFGINALKDAKGRQLSYAMYYRIKRDEAKSRAYYTSLCDNISAGCDSIMGCISKVLSEVNDTPKFLELYDGSISSYRSANGELPLMPFSSTIAEVVKPRNTDLVENTSMMVSNADGVVLRSPNLAYPFYNVQHAVFEFNYGNRGVLNDYTSKPVLENFPGMQDILAKYNASAMGSKKIDESAFATTLSRITYLTRFLYDTRLIGTMLGADKTVFDSDTTVLTKEQYPQQSTDQLAMTINLTKSSDKSHSIETIVKALLPGFQASIMNRADAVVFNIIDMNVMPINVHQLRREVALANIYNYACTFDAYLRDMLDTTRDGGINNTHDMMYNLCVDPYKYISRTEYLTYMKALMQGDSTIDVDGRPKFVSDQIWNKVLFNEVYDSNSPTTKDSMPRSGMSTLKTQILDIISYITNHPAFVVQTAWGQDAAMSAVYDAQLSSIAHQSLVNVNTAIAAVIPTLIPPPADPFTAAVGNAAVADLITISDQAIRMSGAAANVATTAVAANQARLTAAIATRVTAVNILLNTARGTLGLPATTTLSDCSTAALAAYRATAAGKWHKDAEQTLVQLLNTQFDTKLGHLKRSQPDLFKNVKSTLLNIFKTRINDVPYNKHYTRPTAPPASYKLFDEGKAINDYRGDVRGAVINANGNLDVRADGFAHRDRTAVVHATALIRVLAAPADYTQNKGENKDNELTYRLLDEGGDVKSVVFNVGRTYIKQNLRDVGFMRFNTKVVRNLVFFSNIQRVIRMKLDKEIKRAPYPVLMSTQIANSDLTEFSNRHAGLAID